MEPVIAKHIEIRPDRCGGKPCVADTRIRVWDIYIWHELQGQSAEEIVHKFPQVTLADVHAALAYFWDHEAEIRRQMQEVEDLVARLKTESGSGLLDRLKENRGGDDSLPPG